MFVRSGTLGTMQHSTGADILMWCRRVSAEYVGFDVLCTDIGSLHSIGVCPFSMLSNRTTQCIREIIATTSLSTRHVGNVHECVMFHTFRRSRRKRTHSSSALSLWASSHLTTSGFLHSAWQLRRTTSATWQTEHDTYVRMNYILDAAAQTDIAFVQRAYVRCKNVNRMMNFVFLPARQLRNTQERKRYALVCGHDRRLGTRRNANAFRVRFFMCVCVSEWEPIVEHDTSVYLCWTTQSAHC